MSWHRFARLVVPVLVATVAGAAQADSVRYVLTAESSIAAVCRGCEAKETNREPLTGSFDLTAMPVAMPHTVEALTAIDWRSATLAVTGSGFLQRLGADQVAMVIDARVNGASTLLTTGRRQKSGRDEIRLYLSSPKEESSGYAVTIVAVPAADTGTDGDGDGVADATDRCPQTPDANQADGDGDGVGDACDSCPDTSAGSLVVPGGCSLVQACPCSGPTPDEEWSGPRAYVQCVARHLKALRQEGKLGRSEIRLLLQDAVRSGCGGQVVALN